MDSKQASELLQRYRGGYATPKEIRLVEQWYQEMADTGAWHWSEGEKEALEAVMESRLLQRIQTENAGVISPFRRVHFIRRFKWIAAAAIVFLVGGIAYLLFFDKPPKQIALTEQQPFLNDIAPGRNAAVLTLAGGRRIVLDSVGNGTLAIQGNVNLVKTADGQITYNQQPTVGSHDLVYNTLIVPRGSKVVTLTLADGTRVWLNSESTLKYPVAFTGSDRRVEITGEAYFEVAHDQARKFTVAAGDVTTEVLGTHFNVNAYGDEHNIKITLLEGSVKVTSYHAAKEESGEKVVIKPGQQAEAGTTIRVNSKIDVETVMAWKNGLFQMKGTDLAALMRQISRWYDVQVAFEGPLPQKSFGGSINRDVNLSDVMKALEQYGIHSRLEKGIVIIQ